MQGGGGHIIKKEAQGKKLKSYWLGGVLFSTEQTTMPSTGKVKFNFTLNSKASLKGRKI